MVYAIGEILLVVIGILIALQINNWNEQSKSENYGKSLIEAYKLELEEAKKRLERVVITNESRIAVLDSFLVNTDYAKSYRQRISVVNSLYGYSRDFEVSSLLEEVIDNPSFRDKKYLNLISASRQIKVFSQEVQYSISFLDALWNNQINPYFIDSGLATGRYEYDKVFYQDRVSKIITERRFMNLSASKLSLNRALLVSQNTLLSQINVTLTWIEEAQIL